MPEMVWKTSFVLFAGFLLIGSLFLLRPGYLTSPKMLGTMIIAELVVAALCLYRKLFFPILISSFLFAGTGVPFEPTFLLARWYVLGLGAVAGMAIYMKDRNHYFSTFHLLAFCCVLSALVSSMVSPYPEEALLKTTSLLMLFVYCASGARIAVPLLNPDKFFAGIVVTCEGLTYITAFAYFILRWQFYGSMNSLGAVMGVVVVPVTLWGMLASKNLTERRRRGCGLLVAMLLLMSSFSRASIGAAAISALALGVAIRNYRLVLKGAVIAGVIATAAVMFVPKTSSDAPQVTDSDSVSSVFLYKGKQRGDFWASRKGPWTQTWEVIKERPWFGSGFGTSLTSADLTQLTIRYPGSHIDTRLIREHGNSYLAIAEWVGLLGVVPFFSLILFTGVNAGKAFARLRVNQNIYSPMVPCAAVVLAGIVHAAFEDWIFAAGYYVCVFFWSMSFILLDMLHAQALVQELPGEYVASCDSRLLACSSGR
jgi:O-antigen ligase